MCIHALLIFLKFFGNYIDASCFPPMNIIDDVIVM